MMTHIGTYTRHGLPARWRIEDGFLVIDQIVRTGPEPLDVDYREVCAIPAEAIRAALKRYVPAGEAGAGATRQGCHSDDTRVPEEELPVSGPLAIVRDDIRRRRDIARPDRRTSEEPVEVLRPDWRDA